MCGEDLPLVVAELEVPVVGVHHGEGEQPAGPVLDGDEAADLVTVRPVKRPTNIVTILDLMQQRLRHCSGNQRWGSKLGLL